MEPWFHSWYRGRAETLNANYNLTLLVLPLKENKLTTLDHYNIISGSPEITSLEYDMTSYTLSCLSTGGPPSLVTWTKDDITITTESTVFNLSQRITSYENGSYLNVLIGEEALDFIGNFTCAVENERGRSEESISLESEYLYSATYTSNIELDY